MAQFSVLLLCIPKKRHPVGAVSVPLSKSSFCPSGPSHPVSQATPSVTGLLPRPIRGVAGSEL